MNDEQSDKIYMREKGSLRGSINTAIRLGVMVASLVLPSEMTAFGVDSRTRARMIGGKRQLSPYILGIWRAIPTISADLGF